MLLDPDLFADRRAEATEAAEVVERIRTDELIHVTSLRLYLGELRSLELKGEDGSKIAGAEVVDRMWDILVHWATVEQPRLAAEQQRKILTQRIEQHPESSRVLARFNELEEAA